MSIWCSHPGVGYDPDDPDDPDEETVGTVLTFADGYSNHYPDTTGTCELPAEISVATVPPWCVPGHDQDGPGHACTGCGEQHVADQPTGPWLRLDVSAEDSLTWWPNPTDPDAPRPRHTGPFCTSVVLDAVAARALAEQLTAWADPAPHDFARLLPPGGRERTAAPARPCSPPTNRSQPISAVMHDFPRSSQTNAEAAAALLGLPLSGLRLLVWAAINGGALREDALDQAKQVAERLTSPGDRKEGVADDGAREALARDLAATRMVAYDDGKGGHLFRHASAAEQAAVLADRGWSLPADQPNTTAERQVAAVREVCADPDDTQWWPVVPYMDPHDEDEVVETQVVSVDRVLTALDTEPLP